MQLKVVMGAGRRNRTMVITWTHAVVYPGQPRVCRSSSPNRHTRVNLSCYFYTPRHQDAFGYHPVVIGNTPDITGFIGHHTSRGGANAVLWNCNAQPFMFAS